MKRIVFLCACAGLSSAPRADGAMISYSDIFASQAVPGSTTISLPKFDPSLGTLLKVTVSVDATADGGSITFDNESTATPGANVSLTIGATFEALVPIIGAVVASPSTAGAGFVVPDNDAAPNFSGTDSFSVAGVPSMASAMSMLNSGFSFFVAGVMGETFDISVSTETFATFSVMNGFGPAQSTPGSAGGEITVTYQYVPTPPALLAALPGLMAGSRRRRSIAR